MNNDVLCIMSKRKTYRVNVTLKDDIAIKFMGLLQDTRKLEIEDDNLRLMSASKLTNKLIRKALDLIDSNQVVFKDKTINFQESRNRFNIVFYPSDIKQLEKNDFKIKKGLKVDVSIHKTQ